MKNQLAIPLKNFALILMEMSSNYSQKVILKIVTSPAFLFLAFAFTER